MCVIHNVCTSIYIKVPKIRLLVASKRVFMYVLGSRKTTDACPTTFFKPTIVSAAPPNPADYPLPTLHPRDNVTARIIIIIIVVPVARVFFGKTGRRKNSFYDLQTKENTMKGARKNTKCYNRRRTTYII